jgi:uncharacterized protein YodC (DUF2158 family)
MSDLKKGDVVALKSGSPSMTISDLGDYSQGGMGSGPRNGAICVWFDGAKAIDRAFDVETLEKVDA